MTDAARRQRRLRKAELALRALAEHGNAKRAAEYLGVTEDTVRRQVADYCELQGFATPIQAVYALDRENLRQKPQEAA